MTKRDGFTLMEVMIVLTLIALILGLTVAFFASSLTSTKARTAVRDMRNSLRYARALSRTSGVPKVVSIDLDGKRFWISGKKAINLPGDMDVAVLDPISGEIRSGVYRIVFYPTGNTPGTTITLSGRKGTTTIYLDPILGSVAVQ
jgi:prepilin-type N-terminal cleavage/methylation domain-containing protein